MKLNRPTALKASLKPSKSIPLLHLVIDLSIRLDFLTECYKLRIVMRPIKTKKIYEEITDHIINRVKQGELVSGDRLESVEKLAEAFDVSRSAVREALSGLRAMGLVEMRQGEGTFITSFDASSFSLPAVTALIMKRNDLKELA